MSIYLLSLQSNLLKNTKNEKNYGLPLALMVLFSSGAFAQVSKGVNADGTHQKTLRIENAISKESAIAEFGKLYKLDKGNTKELNFSTLSLGVYILNVESAGKKASKRIIID